jgi:cobalt-zinc-cadmium efflux system protein
MSHHHDHGPIHYDRSFAWGTGLNVLFVIAEAVGGVVTNSLALLADAGHNLSDVLGLLLAWGAYRLAKRKPTDRHTYGWRSSTIMAALLNGLILLVAVGGIAWEAVGRLWEPPEVAAGLVMAIAALGVVINTATALLFLQGRKQDLNIRGAYLHMAADAGVSAGVVLAGLAILLTGWTWIDPVISLLIAVAILIGTRELLGDAIHLALQAVPKEIDQGRVLSFLQGLPGVEDVHDLHIWAMSTTEIALTAHVVRPQPDDEDAFLVDAVRGLHDRFHIEHVTLQVERDPDAVQCHQAQAEVV